MLNLTVYDLRKPDTKVIYKKNSIDKHPDVIWHLNWPLDRRPECAYGFDWFTQYISKRFLNHIIATKNVI